MAMGGSIPAKARRLALALAILLLLAAPAPARAAKVWVRAGTLMRLTSGSTVYTGGGEGSMTALKSGWALVKLGGKKGYVPAKRLVVRQRFKVYAAKRLAMYRSASSSSRKLDTYSKGTRFLVGGISGSYAHVCDQDGHKGYVKLSALRSSAPGISVSAGASKKIDKVLSAAKKLLGCSYSRYDCSSFTAHCFSKAGVSISKSVKYQGYMSAYPRVNSVKSLKRGDLVVFNTVSDHDRSDHVGIYIGGGKFVHSSSAAGKVIVSDLSSGYYRRKFSWALRIIR